MACCGSAVPNDRFSTFSDACYTANIPKMKEQLSKHKEPQKIINEKGDVRNYKGGMTPLHRAAQRGSSEVIRFLLEQKADIESVNKSGETALHVACFHRKDAALKKLLEHCSIQTINAQETQYGMTSLHVAISRGSPDLAEALLAAGANPDIRDKNGHTALEMADFWTAQAEAGLVSPTAKHHETRDVLLRRLASSPTRTPTRNYSPRSQSPSMRSP